MSKRRHSEPGRFAPPPKLQSVTKPVLAPAVPAIEVPKCSFLDRIPSELRLLIYEHLVVAQEPLRGPIARSGATYGLTLAILRVNQQIYEEASPLFFGKNTFYVTSIPESECDEDNDCTTSSATTDTDQYPPSLGQIQPPLDPRRFSSLRHLFVDLVYYPSNNDAETTSAGHRDIRPADRGASAYIDNLIALLQAAGPTLHTFKITATVSESFCARKSLISFFIVDRNHTFIRSLASIPLPQFPIHFDFPDCFYHVDVAPDLFLTKSILLLACQVMFCQSQVRIDKLLEQFESGIVGEDAEGMKSRTDLAKHIGGVWPRRVQQGS